MIVFVLLLLLLPQQLRSQPLVGQQELFTKNCAACHGEDARGTSKGP
ncbi:MAG: hypothetical protein QOJ99_634, partial [Bryobacterales bacterium]|nr:hypothetical protein [Bryobacterales bacterium]